jgi:translocation and assembly module TamB
MRKAVTVLAIFFLVILLLVGGIFWLLDTPAGQDFLTKQATSYLRKKLDTRLDVRAIRLGIPDWVALEGVYIEDKSGDTLVSGERFYVNLDMWSLLKGNVGINQVELEGIRLKVNRTLPDTTFNFQFIADAFASGDTTPVDTTVTPMKISLDKIFLRRVHITYKDAVIGTDADVGFPLAEVQFSDFNPTSSKYHPSLIVLKGVRADLRLYEALAQKTPSASASSAPPDPSDTLDVQLGDVDIQDFKFGFIDEVSGLKSGVALGKLSGRIEQTYLEGQQIVVDRVALENTEAFVEFAKKNQQSTSKGETTTPDEASKEWYVRVGDIKITNSALRYDDFNEPAQPQGIDYAHLGVTDLTADVSGLLYNGSTIEGNLARATFREKSGFWLQQAQANFGYTPSQTYLRDFYLKTPSTLLRDELVLRYKNQEQLSDNLGQVQVRLRLQDSRLAFEDILTLVPSLKEIPTFSKNPDAILRGDALITGTVDNLDISRADFSILDGTQFVASGRIRGLPDPDKLGLDLTIEKMASTREDLLRIMPDSALPSSVELPEELNITGTVKGTLEDITMDARIATSLGNGSFTGTIKNATDTANITYDGRLSFQEFDMGKFLKQPPEEIGKITLSTEVQGKGIDPKTMQAQLNGTVQSASIKGYTYNNLNLRGGIENGVADFVADLSDKNIDVKLTAEADLSSEYPTINTQATINRLDLNALNFYDEPMSIQGNVDANLTSTDPANPLGSVSIGNLVIVKKGETARIDSATVRLTMDEDSSKLAVIDAPFLKARMSGTYDYTKLGDLVLTELNKYFTIPDVPYTPVDGPYSLQLTARMASHPLVQLFVPALTRMDTVRLSARIDSRLDTTLTTSLSVPLLVYDSIRTDQARFAMAGLNNRATFSGNVAKVESESFRVRKASLDGSVADNTALMTLMVRDSVNKPQHTVDAGVGYLDEKYRIFLRDELLLDYKTWQTDTTGYIEYGPQGLLARDFGIRRENQRLLVNSQTEQPNGPLSIKLDSVGIGQFIALVTQDSTLANGKLNGDIVLRDYMETPVFTGDLVLKNLRVTEIPVGDLSIEATNQTANRISMNVMLQDGVNDLTLTGDYVTEGNNALDFVLDVNRLSAKTLEAFSFGELRNARGSLTGRTTIRGNADSPVLNGQLAFDSVAFDVKQLGARYRFNDQRINFNGQRIVFNNFTVLDTANQKMMVNGNVSIVNIPDVRYDMNIRANDFTVLNATRKDNDYFYGKALVDANINVKGHGTESIIDGTVKLRPGSDITVLLPDDAAGTGTGEGVVKFVDMSDTTQTAPIDSSKIDTGLRVDFASELSLNIEATDESQMTIILDELNGDNITVRGDAQLNAGIAPNGQLYLLGLYELTQGSYDLTFEVLKKQFTIQKGSTILWTGDPMAAEVDITAIYTVNADISALGAPPGDNGSIGKVPLDVQLIINGSLLNPAISFNIVPSSSMNSDDARSIEQSSGLSSLRNNPAELNKQVFALLVLNKFIADPNATSSSSGGLNAEAIARQSVSQLLTDQLNLLASDLIKGVNVNFNLNSTAEGAVARTDLNVGLSKAFLNDRLTVSVGRNFELENTDATAASSTQIFDNVALNYALTKDGRYMVRAYRKNQYQAVLQGFIVETGVSFIVTLDYNEFRELFQKEIQ